jgi:short subunit dehydrogenase-like uncharacterized protein
MAQDSWLLYGAYGYSGELVAVQARERGHAPILAGRSEDKLRPLAQRLELPFRAFDLEDPAALRRALQGVPLVLHAAGPFVHTAEPMRRACLDVGAHYLDITGEIPVFEGTFALDEAARDRGVALLSGVGFDVVPTDCLAAYVAKRVKAPRSLEVAFASAGGGASAGTLKSMVEGIPRGGLVRRGGQLVPLRTGSGQRRLRFCDRARTAVPIPWGDLVTAFHSTGIPDITTYIAVPRKLAAAQRLFGPMAQQVFRSQRVRGLASALVEWRVKGPSEQARVEGRSFIWARAANAEGQSAEAWLETQEVYAFTAAAAVRSVEQTLARSPRGALTPSVAFGCDFVLEVPDTRRLDALPGA